jgi:hypothetical protein
MDVRNRKAYRVHNIVHGQDFVLGEHPDFLFNLSAMGRVPPQKCESVDHGLRQEPLILIRLHGNVSKALGKFLALVVQKKWQMGECWSGQTEH